MKPRIFVILLGATISFGTGASGAADQFTLSFQIPDAELATFKQHRGLARATARCKQAGWSEAVPVNDPSSFCMEPNMARCAVHLVSQSFRCLN